MLLLLLVCTLPVSAAAGQWLLAEVNTSDAAALVAKKTGGKVLKVTEEERNGQWVFRVKVLMPEGRVKTLFVDKQTGSIGG